MSDRNDDTSTEVDAYINRLPEKVQAKAREMRSLIKEYLPDSSEAIKWGHPAYSYETIMISFGAHKTHLNLYTTPSSIRELMPEIADYNPGKSAIHFAYDTPLPKALIKKVVMYRIKEFREDGVKWM